MFSFTECTIDHPILACRTTVASSPGPLRGERAWYALHAHAQSLRTNFQHNWQNTIDYYVVVRNTDNIHEGTSPDADF